jgi:ABC-type multidrug transport system ATPase subunit
MSVVKFILDKLLHLWDHQVGKNIHTHIPFLNILSILSGSGKTTLLNTLAGRALSGVTGDIWYNNQRYEKGMKRKLAYVLQQDLFFETLTVTQQLTYTALLRLPNNLSKQDKIAQVEQIIDQLRIRKCANTPIMLVSGGEKKRVNIGTELLTNPSVIFLDGK